LQRPEANLYVLRVKQATARFPLERRRGSTVPPAPSLPLVHPIAERWVSKPKGFWALWREHITRLKTGRAISHKEMYGMGYGGSERIRKNFCSIAMEVE
jgi:hypothetical protein